MKKTLNKNIIVKAKQRLNAPRIIPDEKGMKIFMQEYKKHKAIFDYLKDK